MKTPHPNESAHIRRMDKAMAALSVRDRHKVEAALEKIGLRSFESKLMQRAYNACIEAECIEWCMHA